MIIIKVNSNYINDYKNIIQTTNLQKGYQEFVRFFRYLRTYLEKEMPSYIFTSNIVENNMDYSYFQFTNQNLKSKNLKIVIAFIHQKFDYEIWLAGVNRKVQVYFYENLKNKLIKHTLTNNPNRTDYILKSKIIKNCDYDNIERMLIEIKLNIDDFINDTNDILV
ncbi:MAG TPA: hypothetical protein PLT65_03720 [Bacilli bacterium]|nr:hypothetical protein [Bacilli bacterium]